MKLLRYGPSGKEKPGMLDNAGNIRDLSKVVGTIGWDEISPKGLAKLAKIKPDSLPIVKGNPRLDWMFACHFDGVRRCCRPTQYLRRSGPVRLICRSGRSPNTSQAPAP